MITKTFVKRIKRQFKYTIVMSIDLMFVTHGFVMTHCNDRTLQYVMVKASEIILG